MVPFAEPPAFDLRQAVLLLSGGMDPIVPAEKPSGSRASSKPAGRTLTHETLPTGHGLGQMDLAIARVRLAASFA